MPVRLPTSVGKKLLKAWVVEVTEQSPPRIHNLIRLAALAEVSLQANQETLLSKLSLEYVELRYPDELETIDEMNNRATAEAHLRQTEEFFRWLEAQRK